LSRITAVGLHSILQSQMHGHWGGFIYRAYEHSEDVPNRFNNLLYSMKDIRESHESMMAVTVFPAKHHYQTAAAAQ
jgi:hypothetical protein